MVTGCEAGALLLFGGSNRRRAARGERRKMLNFPALIGKYGR
jgi:hypothetical protein